MSTHPQISAGPYNMGHMTASLPQVNYRSGGYGNTPQRYSGQSVVGQMPPMPQMPQLGQQFCMPQHPHMPGYYTPMTPSQQQQPPRMTSQLGYYPGPVVMANPQQMGGGYYYAPSGHYSNQGQFMNSPNGHVPQMQQHSSQDTDVSGPAMGQIDPNPKGSSDGRQSVVRGPPRKPKQSGHAIWIGNLPPQADLMQLVHHVCREAKGLRSLFLISKSNCAFANFKDEETCVAAQQKLHDSKFQTVRLVSRLRKSTVEGATGVTAPTGPAATTPGSSGSPSMTTPPEKQEPPASATPNGEDAKTKPAAPIASGSKAGSGGESSPQKDKFFILKSLTVEDLELSVRTGIWATQSHNEESLNSAFQNVENVYLIFSANKSGEYFGYARMTSEINADPAAAIEFAPKVQSANEVDVPRAIPTGPTEFAPKGRIIDDSARGTIFWEAEREGEEGCGARGEVTGTQEMDEAATQDSGSAKSDGEEQKAWGKPFKLEWLSTARLPFYRTRGLRNPWNSNREVKIARDGTELEPSVGGRLIGLFNRAQSPAHGGVGMRPVHGMATIITGYPPPSHPPPAAGSGLCPGS
ncbi:hypothetical protein MKZ38_010315 [Zalerion maritima]|uniref:YTH domain-containing protein n=1 Tax=Zalerion maritima TaxID=339359 RepID=A0AAD5RSL7_9PEZI|nr:hypothetical protein MKZ38_010315 [Zalerion maritima]